MDPRRLLPWLIVLSVCAVLATGGLVLHTRRAPAPPVPVPVAATVSTPTQTPRTILAAWDERRADAWAAGDVTALRELYVAGSPTGREDVRMLAAYVDRGLRVEGLMTQVLAWEVVEETADGLTVLVTDRVVGGVVVGEGTSVPLPRDRASTRTIVLRRVEGDWRVWAVRERT